MSIYCFKLPVVELSLSSGHPVESISVTSGSRNNSVDFFNLDCNQMYTPKVMATYNGIGQLKNGIAIFFGGTCIATHPFIQRNHTLSRKKKKKKNCPKGGAKLVICVVGSDDSITANLKP